MQKEFVNVMKDAHTKAWARAVKKLPNFDVSLLIGLINDVASKKTTPEKAALKLASEGETAFKVYVKVFAEVASEEAIDELMKKSPTVGVEHLSESDFSHQLVKCSERIQKDISMYMNEKIDAAELIEKIGKTDLADLAKEFADAAGFDYNRITNVKEKAQLIQKLRGISVLEASYISSVAAYVILQSTLKEAHDVHIQDQKIIAQCEENTKMIVAYRNELEKQVNQYFSKYLSSFEKGFAMIDQALKDGDSDEYLAGNATIQNALGRYVQFWDQSSFDPFMTSDEPLKL